MPRGVYDRKAAAEKRAARLAEAEVPPCPDRLAELVKSATTWIKACHMLTGDPRLKSQSDYCLAKYRERRLQLSAYVDRLMQEDK